MIFPYKTGWLLQDVLFPSLTWRIRTQEKVLYLTFDDGPIPDVTDRVIEILARYQAKGTFFCVGDNVRKHPDVLRRVIQAGHTAANHTFNHLNGWSVSNDQYLENVRLCEEQLNGLHIQNRLFRPPYGRISRTQIKALQPDYQIVMWDVLTGDYLQSLDGDKCLRRSISYTRPGTIVVFHDSLKASKNLYHVLPRYIEHFAEAGYRFEALH